MNNNIEIYLLDSSNIFIGKTQHSKTAALPKCTLTVPPEVTAPNVAQWQKGKWVILVEYPTPAKILPSIDDFTNALTLHLDVVAQQRKYDNRITCMVRAGFAGPFQAEALAFAAWADTCNALAYQLLAEVQAGTRPIPESTQALIDELPEMQWPE